MGNQTTINHSDVGPPTRVHGHFGEWIQGRLGPDGPVVLVTMTCDVLFVEATFEPAVTLGLTHAGQAAITRDQLRSLLSGSGRPVSGNFHVTGNVPLGVGAGASTAWLVSLARAAGVAENDIAAACLRVEKATDPLMLQKADRVLWSSRSAEVSAQFSAPPRCEIVGGYFGDPIKTNAGDTCFADISDLIGAWQEATHRGDLAALAGLASEAADRTTRLRGPKGDPTAAVAKRLGALGYARAHTGSARALIFPPEAAPFDAENVLEQAGITGAFRFFTGSGS